MSLEQKSYCLSYLQKDHGNLARQNRTQQTVDRNRTDTHTSQSTKEWRKQTTKHKSRK